MPYIRKGYRAGLDDIASSTRGLPDGDLNYLITKILLTQEPSCYSEFNRLIGVLECCKQEFYRRAVAAYEDKKAIENGDVY